MWENILEGELKRSESLPVGSRIALIAGKVKQLAKIYAGSQKYFPIGELRLCLTLIRGLCIDLFTLFSQDYIIRKLELFSCLARAEHGWVFQAFLSVGVPLPKLLESYNK